MSDVAAPMKLEIVKVTPQRAADWLGNEWSNRKLRRALVVTFLQDMKAGHWRLTGDTLKFSSEGRLLDGQHRLKALIEYGHPMEFAIAWNVPVEAQENVDMGLARQVKDILEIRGEENSGLVAGVARWVCGWEAGGRWSLPQGSQRRISRMDVAVRVDDAIRRAAGDIVPGQSRIMSGPCFGFCRWLLAQVDEGEANQFLGHVVIGDTDRRDPARELRERLMEEKIVGSNLRGGRVVALTIVAWNYHVEGRQTDRLILPKLSAFPRIGAYGSGTPRK